MMRSRTSRYLPILVVLAVLVGVLRLLRVDARSEPQPVLGLIQRASDRNWTDPDLTQTMRNITAHLQRRFHYIASHAKYDVGSLTEERWQLEFYMRMALMFSPGQKVTVCETGFNMGASALMWLHTLPAATLHTFDFCDRKGGHVMNRYIQRKFPGQVNLHCGNTRNTLPALVEQIPRDACDIIHIDGGHEYADVVSDFNNLRVLANPDRHLLLIDDTNCEIHFCNGPNRVVQLAVERGLMTVGYRYHTKDGLKGFTAGVFVDAGSTANQLPTSQLGAK